ncbi:hypothetical protein FKP32DRAFT_569845 [Trametes sanguinea]|nr:hypothetical protein FKP32DRAFT_569845 [Trametes sanguinea]
MSSLAPPSPSVSPAPGGNAGGRSPNFRASMGPSARPVGSQGGLPPASPRPGANNNGARPTSELLGGAGMFQTPEAEAIDQWFETFQNYEATLEEMAAASLDVNFKEELSAIEQCEYCHLLDDRHTGGTPFNCGLHELLRSHCPFARSR